MKRNVITILLSLFFATHVFSQNGIQIPEIINFSKKTYESGNQNRAIAQDRRGLLYFANDDGLLVFDGTWWRTYPLPNGSIVRSLFVQGDRIYIGGQQEIGYFYFDPCGVLTYKSLKPLIAPGETEFTDVWRIVGLEDDIFFQSNKRIFRYHGGTVTAFKSSNWAFLGVSRNILIAQEYIHGLMTFKDGGWLPISIKYDFSKDKVGIRCVSNFGMGKILIGTLKSGLYILNDKEVSKFETPSIDTIAAENILASCMIDTSLTAIATRLGGYYIIDTKGEIVQHLTKLEGLQSNSVNTVFLDKEKNIWLGLTNGIDLVMSNSAISHINPNHDNKSPGYSAAIYDDQLFIGTGLGLYSIPVQPDNSLAAMQKNFNFIRNSNGLIWGLSVVNSQLLVGRNDGAYIIQDNNCIPLDTTTGFWFFQPLSVQQPCPHIIAGTYNGVNIYNYTGGKFVNPKAHTFFESAKNMVVIGDDIWVAHPYQGLYRIYINQAGLPVSKPYKDLHNILTSGHIHIFKVRNKIILLTRKGIFEYDKSLGDFKGSPFFNRLFGSSSISYLREDTEGNVWFIGDKKPGVVDLSSPEDPVITYFPELNNRVLGNDEEFIYPINKNNVLIAGEIGFYHINYEKYKGTNRDVKVLLRSVTAFYKKDSTLCGGYLPGEDSRGESDIYNFKDNVGFKWNSIHFEYSSPYYGGTVEYSCRLKGYEKEWSDWSKRSERSYTNLPAGNYEFEVSARNSIGRQSSPARFVFTISSPWYKTITAYIIYIILTRM